MKLTGFDPAQGKMVPIACSVEHPSANTVRIRVSEGYSLVMFKGATEIAVSDGEDTWRVHVKRPEPGEIINVFYKAEDELELCYVKIG